MNDDDLDLRFDDELRRESATRAGLTAPGMPDLERVQRRASTLNHRRRAWQTGVVVAGVLVVGSTGLYLANDGSPDSGAPIATEGPTPSGSPTSAAPPTAREQLLTQLQDRPDVRRHLLGVSEVDGAVLCGLSDLGRSQDEKQVYVWLYCGSYTTGPRAENISAGTDPAVVSVTVGDGGAVQVSDVAFPPMGDRAPDIREMFPPQVAERIIAGDLTFEPTEDDLLRVAEATTE